MKGRIIRGVAGMAAAVLAVISVSETVPAVQEIPDVLADHSEYTIEQGSLSKGMPEIPYEVFLAESEVEKTEIVDTDNTETLGTYDADTVRLNENTAVSALASILASKDIMALVYLTDECKLYSEADKSSEVLTSIPEGNTVYIRGVGFPAHAQVENSHEVMYRVSCYIDGSEYSGYVERKYLAYSDEDLIGWEQEYLADTVLAPESSDAGLVENKADGDVLEKQEGYSVYGTTYEDVDRFPYSYRSKLNALKSSHSDWVFVPMNTGLDFNTAVSNEMGDKSWIYINDSNTANGWVGNATGQGKWAYATQAGVQFHMDPRNSLTDSYIFQFEQLTFNKSYHTVEAIQNFLNGTFMKGSLPDGSMTFADAFYQIGSSQGVSPIHLASRVYQEQGRGTSPLISGTYSGYEGYYNYFNVGATGKTEAEVIKNGLEYAKNQGWNTPYKALTGGASTIGNGYIKKGQDTGYLEKFNVNPNASHALYTHQYMQNIQAPRSESSSTKTMYANAGCLDSSFVFKIPVFNNMGGEEEPRPITSFTLKPVTINEHDEDGKVTGTNLLFTGQTAIPEYEYEPGDTTDPLDVTYTSGNTNVAVIDGGRIRAVSNGTSVITAKLGEFSSSITVTVKNCNAVFMRSDNTTRYKTVELSYNGSLKGDPLTGSGDYPDPSSVKGTSSDNTFAGWYTGPDGTGKKVDGHMVFNTGETLLYPCFIEHNRGFYVLPVGDAVYTGSAIKPEVEVYDSPENTVGLAPVKLELNKDYTVSYKNNKNVNTSPEKRPVVIIKGKGNYSGTQYAYFNILPKPITDSEISCEDVTLAYNGKVQKGSPVVAFNGKNLKKGTDYTIEYPVSGAGAYRTSGTWPVRIKGKGNFTGSVAVNQTITAKILISKVTVKPSNIVYDKTKINKAVGKGMEPPVKVTYKGRDLMLSTDGGKTGDYTLEFSDNTDIGKAYVTVRAADGSNYAGSRRVSFKITGTSLKTALISGLEPVTYTGNESDVKQKAYRLELKDGTMLKGIEEEAYEGLSEQAALAYDYTVSYLNISKAGTAKIVFRGVNAYTGTVNKSYKILKAPVSELYSNIFTLKYYTEADAAAHGVEIKKNGVGLEEAFVTSKGVTVKTISKLDDIRDDYEKGGSRPQIILYFRGVQLDDTDFKVSYKNNGRATAADLPEEKKPVITLSGKKNLSGSISGIFNISDGDFANEKKINITAQDVIFTGKKNKWKASVVLRDANGNALKSGTDYESTVIYTYASKVTEAPDANGNPVSRNIGDEVAKDDIPPAGTYIKAEVTSKGSYDKNAAGTAPQPLKRSVTYRVVAVNIGSSAVRAKVANKEYLNGRAVTLSANDITLTCGTQTLVYGEDFILDENSYHNNVNKGTASVMIYAIDKTSQGNTNYGGSRKLTFKIKQRGILW